MQKTELQQYMQQILAVLPRADKDPTKFHAIVGELNIAASLYLKAQNQSAENEGISFSEYLSDQGANA